MSLKKYVAYKKSDIDYLAEIPEHWSIERLASIGSFSKGSGISRNDLVEKGLPAILYGDLYTKYDIQATEIINKISVVTAKQSEKIKVGAILFTGSGETLEDIGKSITYLGQDTYVYVGGDAIIFKQKKVNSLFLSFCLSCEYTTLQKIKSAKGNIIFHVYASKLRNLLIAIPTSEEQTKIADFLKHKTLAIDKKISLLKRKINYYKELRKSLISEVVAKGLNKTVKLKNSGIEWVGQIPEHWEIKRLKSLGEIETSSVNKKIEEGEAVVKLVNYKDVYGNSTKEIWNNDNYMVVSAKVKQLQTKKLKKGDVLFTPSSETIEDIGVSAVVMENLENTLYSYHILRLKFKKNIFMNFKKYMLNNDFVQYYFSKSATGTTRKILGLNTFYNLPVLLPSSIQEQKQIADYLDSKTQAIDAIVTKMTKQIESLKEFRKALINDVVTGKLKVSE